MDAVPRDRSVATVGKFSCSANSSLAEVASQIHWIE
jgi:hypothetical protein